MLVPVPCPRCRSSLSSIVVEGRDYLYGITGDFYASECQGCGLWYQNPRPSDDALVTLYPSHYTPHRSSDGNSPSVTAGRASYLKRKLGYQHLTDDRPRSGARRALGVLDSLRRWSTGVDL